MKGGHILLLEILNVDTSFNQNRILSNDEMRPQFIYCTDLRGGNREMKTPPLIISTDEMRPQLQIIYMYVLHGLKRVIMK